MLIVALLVVGVIVVRLLTADERKLAAGRALEFTQQLRAARANIRPCEPLRTNLRERTKRALAAPAIAGAFALVFAMGSADGLANIGPQTTGGQWWRLLTSAFVQPGVLALIVSLAGFVQPALLLERLVGPIAFVSVFAAAAATGGVVQLAINPVGVNYGAAAAICGVYGLLAVVVAFGAIWPSPVTIPFLAIKRMAPANGHLPPLSDRSRRLFGGRDGRLHHRAGMRRRRRVRDRRAQAAACAASPRRWRRRR